ncbi:MAG: hypothetical protein JO215_00850 [Ktedonobacteraceae bacterium]|nr:hypothetical protein [Ktedonobacteraceae bacterium]
MTTNRRTLVPPFTTEESSQLFRRTPYPSTPSGASQGLFWLGGRPAHLPPNQPGRAAIAARKPE